MTLDTSGSRSRPLPPELWDFIIQHLSPADLFSIYNTSTMLRTVTAPYLVQVIASKSVKLFFYQEYVSRTGVTFVFDHFDIKKDKVVFKPQTSHQRITFRNGIIIQRPQLEEITVRSRARFQGRRIDFSEKEGIYSLHDSNEGLEGTTMGTSVSTNDDDFSRQHFDSKFSVLNYLDRVCALNIKQTGSRLLSGAKHSFGQNYPWALHYIIENTIAEGGPLMSRRRSNSSHVRYVQANQFECSINFLDPRRASQSLFRRWIEGKMGQLLQIVKSRQVGSVISKKKTMTRTKTLDKKKKVMGGYQVGMSPCKIAPVPAIAINGDM
ncbi:hypothetical protein BGZ46_000664 [Entomortierella lignicola]|nr:hypothetical protein BGZ46_000664 [Entomortierella lignicola]